METAPSEDTQGAAEETVEVDDEKELVGYLNAPNKDTNTYGGDQSPPLPKSVWPALYDFVWLWVTLNEMVVK